MLDLPEDTRNTTCQRCCFLLFAISVFQHISFLKEVKYVTLSLKSLSDIHLHHIQEGEPEVQRYVPQTITYIKEESTHSSSLQALCIRKKISLFFYFYFFIPLGHEDKQSLTSHLTALLHANNTKNSAVTFLILK